MSALLVQLSDLHIGGTWGGGDATATAAAAVEMVRRLEPAPAAVLISGDLADTGSDAEYDQIQQLLGGLTAPIHVLAGNHDDRDALHRHFGVPGAGGAPVQYAVDVGRWRLIVLDTMRPGMDSGQLDAARLGWLDAALTAAPDQLTLIAMHHPPALTGLPSGDRIGLPADERRAFADIVARHAQVRGIVAGHLHRTVLTRVAGRPLLVAPSTYVQARLDFRAEQLVFPDEPPGFAIHLLGDDELVSHLQVIDVP